MPVHRLILALALLPFIAVFFGGCSQPDNVTQENLTVEADFVGDESCASCHEDIYMSYHRTGMGKSVSLFDPETAPEHFDDAWEVYDERSGYYYRPIIRNDTLVQEEYRKNSEGEIIYRRVHEADLVVGSGNATRSYFMNTNGYVTQMPLTWYAQSQKWDMSPAYEQNNMRFSREISPQCMTCHNGLPEHSPFTQNHYEVIPLGITCERCHGPGGEHNELRLAGLGPTEGEPDPTIVNPGRLDRERQLSVCQQCHLTGIMVFEPGEDMQSFRPGQLLSDNRTVFATKEQIEDPERFGISSHGSRLARSACYKQSSMTCVTCHNPHEPVSELGQDYFNQACQSCHEPSTSQTTVPFQTPASACNRPSSVDIEDMGANCVDCHLQKSGTSDIPHVTFTDHWIRRTLPPPSQPDSIERILTRTIPFMLDRVESEANQGTPQVLLEEAIAYFEFYETRHTLPDYLPEIIQKARQGLNEGADHPEGRLSLARALIELDSLDAANRVLNEAIAAFPEHARLHYWLGEVKVSNNAFEEARAAFQRAVDISPRFSQAQLKLADVFARMSRVEEAEQAYLDLINSDPLHHPEGFNNLGFLYLNLNRLDEALSSFEKALALDPSLATAWTNAGSIHLYHQNFEQAAYHFEQALAIDNMYIPALGNLAQAYWQLNRTQDARAMLRQLLSINPNDQRARGLLEAWR